ncbi:hypothetical protein [Dictyobacter kobayashii]|uniref:Uncharacterized protein n=1 Tax=Dictyobacter kobayashii TaxID=2014872 RepID=A0A402AEN8_9CHLR|nr:hypothetical protein [Dictyobacter kobayashii]GCE17587.1 hypothetical protein KDK_13870 [Dictyobacter kobayashii]
MTITHEFMMLLEGAIWVVCLLLGVGLGTLLGRWSGVLLGWMVATSLDANILKGGRLGKRLGAFIGIGIGLAVAAFYANQLVTMATHQFIVH